MQRGIERREMRPVNERAVTALVLGVLGLVLCGFLAPAAWIVGRHAIEEMDANPGLFEGRAVADAGRRLGMWGTVVWLGLLVLMALLGLR